MPVKDQCVHRVQHNRRLLCVSHRMREADALPQQLPLHRKFLSIRCDDVQHCGSAVCLLPWPAQQHPCNKAIHKPSWSSITLWRLHLKPPQYYKNPLMRMPAFPSHRDGDAIIEDREDDDKGQRHDKGEKAGLQVVGELDPSMVCLEGM